MNLKNAVIASIILLTTSVLIQSCQPQGGPAYDGAKELQIVDNWFTNFQAEDMDATIADIAEGTWMYGPGLSDSVQVEEWAQNWKSAFEDGVEDFSYVRSAAKFMEVSIEENPRLAGHWVLEWGQISGNWSDGTSATFWWHGAFRIAEGKIIMMRAFYDNADLLQQRGWTVTPPEELENDTTESED